METEGRNKTRLGLERMRPCWALFVLALLLLSVPSIAASTYIIAPGGSYTIRVTVKKTPYIRLREGDWEVRAYFYDGTTNYCTGNWTDFGYSGWWQHRYRGDDWTDSTETRTVNVGVQIVPRPRPEIDKQHGMGDIPLNTNVSFRIRLIVHDVQPEFPDPEAESGLVTFQIGGYPFQYSYTRDDYGRYHISGQGFEGMIDRSTTGEWRLMVDLDLSAYVTEDAPTTATFTISQSLNLTLQSTAAPEPTLTLPDKVRLVGSVIVIIIPVGIGLYMALRRKTEELPVPEY